MTTETCITVGTEDHIGYKAPEAIRVLARKLRNRLHKMDETDRPRAAYIIGEVLGDTEREKWDWARDVSNEIIRRVDRKR